MKAKELRAKGYSLKDIVKMLGSSPNTVLQWLKVESCTEYAEKHCKVDVKPDRRDIENCIKRGKLKPRWVLAEEVEPGDYVVVPKIKVEVHDVEVLDVAELLKDYPLIVEGDRVYYVGRNQYGAEFKHHCSAPRYIKLDEDFWRLVGYYLAEGSIAYHNDKVEGVVWTFGADEDEYVNDVVSILRKLGFEAHVRQPKPSVKQVWCYSTVLGLVFERLFGRYHDGKKLPEWVLYLPESKLRELLKGLFRGDGAVEARGSCVRLELVNERLVWQVFMILLRLGYIATVHYFSNKNSWRLQICGKYGRKFAKEVLGVNIAAGSRESTHVIELEDYFLVPVVEVRREPYMGYVYNLHVEHEENYCIPIVVHNSGEGFGIPVLEAMAVGVPVIANAVTSHIELVSDDIDPPRSRIKLCRRGILVKPRYQRPTLWTVTHQEYSFVDPRDFAEALALAYNMGSPPPKWLQNNCVEFAKDHDWSKIVDRFAAVLLDVEPLALTRVG